MVSDTERHEEMMRSLKNIEAKLDVLITLQKAIAPKPTIGKEEKKILKLCDRKHSVDDIMKVTGKKEGNVNVILSNLRKKALIRSVKSRGKTTYERI